MDLPDSFAPTHGSPLAWTLPLLASALLFVPARFRARATAGLVVAAVLAVSCYVDFGRFRYGSYLNEWDVYHYYLGTKYLDELGYEGLYEATLVADAESLRRYQNPHGRIRDLATTRFVDVDSVLARRDTIRARFTDARWREFVADVGFFATSLPGPRFSILLEDRGFNGTPVWAAVIRTLLSGPLSIRSDLGRTLMLAVDPLLLTLAFLAIHRAYGLRAAAISVVMLGTHYLLSWGHLKGALVRTDFAVCVVLGLCAAKLERPALAGGLLAWAAVSRVFPALVMLGPVAALLAGYARSRTWDRALVRMLGGFVLTASLATALALVLLGDTGPFVGWLEKITRHASDPVSVDVGYRTLIDAHFTDGIPEYLHLQPLLREDRELALERGLALGTVLLTVLVPATVFASRMRTDRAIAFGYVFVFFAVAFAYYYALALLPFLLFFVADEDAPLARLGATTLLVGGALGYLFFSGYAPLAHLPPLRGYHQEFGTYYYSSWCVAVAVAVAIASAGIEAYRAERREAVARTPA